MLAALIQAKPCPGNPIFSTAWLLWFTIAHFRVRSCVHELSQFWFCSLTRIKSELRSSAVFVTRAWAARQQLRLICRKLIICEVGSQGIGSAGTQQRPLRLPCNQLHGGPICRSVCSTCCYRGQSTIWTRGQIAGIGSTTIVSCKFWRCCRRGRSAFAHS